jgi:hypothetical protein
MHSALHRLLAQARTDELRRTAVSAAHADRPRLPPRPALVPSSVTLRFGFPDDAAAISRLAALDGADPPRQPILLAEVAGELRAVVSLSDGSAIADPFHASAPIVELLRTRAAQLDHAGRGARRRRRASGRLRLVPRR